MTSNKGQFGKGMRLILAILISIGSLNPGVLAAVADTSNITEAPQAETSQGISGAVTGVAPAVAESGSADTIDSMQAGPLGVAAAIPIPPKGEEFVQVVMNPSTPPAPLPMMDNGPYQPPTLTLSNGRFYLGNTAVAIPSAPAGSNITDQERLDFANLSLAIREQSDEINFNFDEIDRIRGEISAILGRYLNEPNRIPAGADRDRYNALILELGPNNGRARLDNIFNRLVAERQRNFEARRVITDRYRNHEAYFNRVQMALVGDLLPWSDTPRTDIYSAYVAARTMSRQNYWRERIRVNTDNYGNPR